MSLINLKQLLVKGNIWNPEVNSIKLGIIYDKMCIKSNSHGNIIIYSIVLSIEK